VTLGGQVIVHAMPVHIFVAVHMVKQLPFTTLVIPIGASTQAVMVSEPEDEGLPVSV
jgi:nitrate reductase gamma subunit